MTKEEFFKPRYKVIADWPKSTLREGTIITFETIYPYSGLSYIFNESVVSPEYIDAFPHLFKKLHWWEERKVEDMPEYVKCECTDFIKFKKGQVIRVEKHQSNTYNQRVLGLFISKDKQGLDPMMNCVHYKNFIPSTEQEYNEYISKKTTSY